MVFAAGFGTRMQPLTNHTPKPLIQIGKTCLLDHTLDLAKQAGLTKCVVNAHYLAEQIKDHLAGTTAHVVVEDEILDTGGGLKNAAPLLDGDMVITSNSDNIWNGENPFSKLLCASQVIGETALLVAHKDNVTGRSGPGDFELHDDGTLTRHGDYVFLGIQQIALHHVLAEHQSVFSMNVVWDKLIEQGKLF
mgnify:CR=1 FL=1